MGFWEDDYLRLHAILAAREKKSAGPFAKRLASLTRAWRPPYRRALNITDDQRRRMQWDNGGALQEKHVD
jgi:hypothetical protein